MATSPPRQALQLKSWHAALALAAFTALYFSKILFGKAFLWEDFLEQEIPYRVFAAQSLAHGSFPLWNPYTFCGMPFFAELQTAVLYPTNLLLTFLIAPGSLGTWWIEFFILSHFWIAAFGMFMLARRELNIGAWGALFAAVAYGFSGMMVTHAIHQGMIFQFACLPWVVLCMLRGARTGTTKWFLLGGIVLGLSLLSGHPQITLYTFTGLGILTLFLLWDLWRTGTSSAEPPETPSTQYPVPSTQYPARITRAIKLALRAAAMIAIAVGIFAVQYLPSVELADRVVRSEVTYQFASEGSLQWEQLATAFVPKYFGSSEATQSKLPFWIFEGKNYFLFWETCFYCGIATLVFAAVGMWKGKRAPLRGGLIALAAFAVMYALGDNFVLFPALFQLPLFNKFRDPARIMYLFTFAAAIFAGRGLDLISTRSITLFAKKNSQWVWLGAGVVFGFILLTVGDSTMNVPEQLAAGVHAQIWIFIVLWVLTLLLLWRLNTASNAALQIGAVALLAVDLFIFGGGINNGTRDPNAAYNQYPSVLAKLRAESKDQLFRVRMREGGAMLMQRNQGPVDRLFLIEGYSPLVLQRHIPLMISQAAQADLMNVRYEVVVDSAKRSLSMRERSGYTPRAFIVHHVRVLDDAGVMAAVKQEFDFRTTVYLEKDPGLPLTDIDQTDPTDQANQSPAVACTITSYQPNEIRIAAQSAENGVLVTGEISYPGWNATLDGKPVEVLNANSCLRAVALPSGSHEVVFRFSPEPVTRGAWISGSAFVIALLGFVGLSLRKSKK